jgi:hypothetical protein
MMKQPLLTLAIVRLVLDTGGRTAAGMDQGPNPAPGGGGQPVRQ